MEEKLLPIVTATINGLVIPEELTLEAVVSPEGTDAHEKLSALRDAIDKFLKEWDANIKTDLQTKYMETGEQTVSNGKESFTFVPGGFRETVDTKRLKAEQPELYTQYVKTSQVAPSIRITKKKES